MRCEKGNRAEAVIEGGETMEASRILVVGIR